MRCYSLQSPRPHLCASIPTPPRHYSANPAFCCTGRKREHMLCKRGRVRGEKERCCCLHYTRLPERGGLADAPSAQKWPNDTPLAVCCHCAQVDVLLDMVQAIGPHCSTSSRVPCLAMTPFVPRASCLLFYTLPVRLLGRTLHTHSLLFTAKCALLAAHSSRRCIMCTRV